MSRYIVERRLSTLEHGTYTRSIMAVPSNISLKNYINLTDNIFIKLWYWNTDAYIFNVDRLDELAEMGIKDDDHDMQKIQSLTLHVEVNVTYFVYRIVCGIFYVRDQEMEMFLKKPTFKQAMSTLLDI